jgi:hypothetical protein
MIMSSDQSGWKALVTGMLLGASSLSLGCGGSGDGRGAATGSVTGAIQGRAFNAKAGAFDQVGELSLLVALPEFDGICQLATSGWLPAGDMVWLSIFVCVGSADAVGEYPVQPGGGSQSPCPGRVAWAEIRRFLGGTPSLIPVDSGTVTIQTQTDQDLAGTAALAIGGDSLAGSFSATFCADLNKP